MPARLRHLPIAWLLALLLVPAAAWLAGGRQGLLDNRAKTAFPHPSAGALRHGKTYKQLDAAFFERLPPRADALEVHGRISVTLFGDSSNPLVALGDHGWRYYLPGLRTCGNAPPKQDPADEAEILARTLVAAGKRALVLEPADKLFMHGRDVPGSVRGDEACAAGLQRAVERRLTTTPGGGSIDGELRRLEAAGQPTFLKTDTHWNATGRLVYVRRVLDTLRPGLADQLGVHLGDTYNKHGDLNAMLGLTHDGERDRAVVADRPAAPPFAPGDALIVGDSQTERAFTDPLPGMRTSLGQQALAGVPVCSVPDVATAKCDAALLAAKVVTVESVGRNLIDFETMCQRPVTILGERMTGPSGRYEAGDGSPRADPTRLATGAGGFDEVRIAVPGGDARPVPRLIRIPVQTLPAGTKASLTQDPHNGLAAPCATPDQGTAGGSLILPVPAGRKLSDLPIVLTATPGTVFGAPREILLDGTPARRASPGG